MTVDQRYERSVFHKVTQNLIFNLDRWIYWCSLIIRADSDRTVSIKIQNLSYYRGFSFVRSKISVSPSQPRTSLYAALDCLCLSWYGWHAAFVWLDNSFIVLIGLVLFLYFYWRHVYLFLYFISLTCYPFVYSFFSLFYLERDVIFRESIIYFFYSFLFFYKGEK